MKLNISNGREAHAMRFFSVLLALILGVECFGAVSVFAAEETPPPANDAVDEAGLDVARMWADGPLTIEKGGRYFLSEDVHTNGTLCLTAPAGETVTFDFAGHSAAVAGVVTAGIDTSLSQGTVVIEDSSYTKGDVQDRLIIDAVKADGAVAGILWNAQEPAKAEGAEIPASPRLEVNNIGVKLNLNSVNAENAEGIAHDAYGAYFGYAYEAESNTVDATINNSAFSVSINNIELAGPESAALLADFGEKTLSAAESGVACAVFTKAGGIKLDGGIKSELLSVGGTVDLYSTVPSAFTIERGFLASHPLSVYSNGNPEGEIFALQGAGLTASDDAAKAFVDGSTNGFMSAYDANGFFFAPKAESLADIEDGGDAVLPALDGAVDTDGDIIDENVLPMLADAADPVVSQAVSPLELESKNLNTLWTATGAYSITSAGSYYLTADLQKTSYLTINAPGADVEIHMNGYMIYVNASSTSRGVVYISNAKSVTIDDGILVSKNQGINGGVVNGNILVSCIYSSAADVDLTIRNLQIQQEILDAASTVNSLKYGVYVANGAVTAVDCSISVDISKARVIGTGSNRHAYGIYLGAGVQSALISQCEIAASSPGALDTAGLDTNAYGLYSLTSNPVTVKGGNITVSSPNCSAAALYGKNLILENGTSQGVALNISGVKNEGVGIQSTGVGGVVLNSNLAVSFTGNIPLKKAALASTVEQGMGAFQIGPQFVAASPETPLGVFIGSDEASANDKGIYFASYCNAYVPDETRKAQLKGFFANAAAGGATDVDADSNGLFFNLEEAKAAAVVTRGDETIAYATVASGAASLLPGDTLKLMREAAYGINILAAKGSAEDTYFVDLNGFNAAYVASASAAEISVSNSGEAESSINGSNPNAEGVSLWLNSAGKLVLNDINITSSKGSTANAVVCNEKAGTIVLNDVEISGQTGDQYITGARNKVSGGTIQIDGGGIALSSTILAYGAYASAGSDIVMTGCPVTVSSTSAYGLYAAGTGASIMAGGAPADALPIISCAAVTNAYALYGASGSFLALDNYAANARGGGTEVYSFASGTAATLATLTAELTLDGVCSFNAPFAHKTPLKIGADFALPEDSAAVVLKNPTSGLDDDVFAVASDEISDISGKSVFFAPDTGLPYGDYMIGAKEGNTKLYWTKDPVAKNVKDGGNKYATVAAAIADAEEGDTLQLIANSASAPLLVGKALTIDLNGFDITINAGVGLSETKSGEDGNLLPGNYTNAAFAYTGQNTLTIKDSVADAGSKGNLLITIGRAGELTPSTVEAPPIYKGIVNNKGGQLILDDCNVTVTYTGKYVSAANSTTTPAITAWGIYNQSGTLSINGQSKLTVNANSTPSGFGAVSAYGVYIGGAASDTPRLRVSSNASIAVNNNAVSIERATTLSTGNAQGGGLSVREIKPGTESAQYKEIQALFLKSALFNAEHSVYYAAPLTLADGTSVWAYSEPVPSEKIGDLGSVIAAKMFVLSRYTVVPEAIGIGASENAEGDIQIAGAITANAPDGNATGVAASGKGTWRVGNAALTATGGDAKYKNGGAVDDSVLSAILPLATVGSQNYLVLDADLAASGISAANGAAIVLDGKTEADTQARSSIDILAAQFAIGASFPHTPRAALTVGSPSGENKQGDVFAVAADNASFSEPDRALFTDAQGRLTVALANGQLAWDGLYAVSFKDGEAILRSNSGLIYGEPVLPPPASEMKREDGANADLHIYTFLGWSLDPECGAESFGASGSSDIPAGQTTLSVTGNAVYHAIFAQTPRQIAILFTGIKDTNGDSLPDVQGSASIGGTLADAGLYPIANAPQDYPSGGYAYRFVGWRIGSSAFNQVWDPGEIGTKLILDYKISGASQGLVTMEAYYAKVGAAQSLVTFKVDYMLSAYAVNKTSAPTYRGASGTTTTVPTKIAAVSGTSYSFKGWYKGKSIVATGDVNYTPSASLPVAESDAVYTARFEESLAKYNITYVYHWKSGETGSFVLNYVDVVSTASGSDPFASLKPSDFKQDGLVYTFLGWSTRQGDKTPLFMGDGPAVTAAARYYAIYTSAPYTVSVTFKSGDEICAAAENVTPGQQSVTALFADTKASEPAAPSGKIFRGWSATANGTSWITGIIEITENQTYYAVFTNPDPKTVTFYDEDKSSVIKRILVDEHSAVADSGKAPTTPWKNGCWFTGWLDIAFKPFKLQTEIIARDTDLYASYAPIEKNVEAGSGAVADLGSTSLVLPGIEDATGVRFDLLLLQSADGDISGKAKEDGYAVLTTYRAALSYSTAGSSAGPLSILPLNIPVSGPVFGVLAADGTINPLAAEPGNPILSDFGSVKLVLPVTDTAVSKAKVYYLKLDGSVGVSDEKTVTGGKIEFTLTGYSLARADRGNLAVAALKAADKTDDPDKTNTEEKTLKDAIAAAQGQLKEQYEKYDKTKYTSGNWLGLVSEYETARIAIGNATTASAIQAQLLGGVSAMGAVPTGTLSSSAGSTTDTSDATEAELTSSAGTGTSGSALSSSATGSALSSSASAGLLASGAGLSGSDVKSDADKLEEKYLEALRIADIADAYKSYGEGFVWPIGDPGDDISNLRLYIRAFAEREAEFNARDDANKPAEAKAAIKRCADGISKYADALAAYIASPDDPAVQSSLRSAGKELVSAYENMKSVLDGLPEEEVEDEQEDGVTTVALTETPKSPPAIDDSGLSNEAKTGFSQWVKTHIALACIIGIVILAAIAALVWWLLRRRNRLAAEGVDAPTGGDGMDEDWVKLA